MWCRPMRCLEITDPEGWARREHAKSLLAAKAAAAAAAKEAEANAAEATRLYRQKIERQGLAACAGSLVSLT